MRSENVEGTFWEVCQKSKEGDVLTCVDWKIQNIVNNGDYTFMWEEDWEYVRLNNEFLGARWKIN
ncbi:hypothetical protein [Virgibacillus salexigens]|uniref:hypothetical protein n=1 Tax=Virgibacillus salexigens TaxID=61016 RepID=UPI00190B5A01|nr:hypothetical protein [Virgibacillus salexigens]